MPYDEQQMNSNTKRQRYDKDLLMSPKGQLAKQQFYGGDDSSNKILASRFGKPTRNNRRTQPILISNEE